MFKIKFSKTEQNYRSTSKEILEVSERRVEFACHTGLRIVIGGNNPKWVKLSNLVPHLEQSIVSNCIGSARP